jgi:hypothetical protein
MRRASRLGPVRLADRSGISLGLRERKERSTYPGQGPRFFCGPLYTHETPDSLHRLHVPGSPFGSPPASHRTLRDRQALHALVVLLMGAREPMRGEYSSRWWLLGEWPWLV